MVVHLQYLPSLLSLLPLGLKIWGDYCDSHRIKRIINLRHKNQGVAICSLGNLKAAVKIQPPPTLNLYLVAGKYRRNQGWG